ncbi:BfmA/BtgA family mobilization protein [Bacteroides sp. 51]|uniref:BfmA/BtgA family mobilization protein n=1 Tax=Bacteroides sp. 51 TaxID=2302938 RepID=UPI0013D3C652|nr:BfmA/BtgA family mobilization protein [Bacteroides sp. 51]NDV83452.1 hypothetical protein [Bacteroides sp. 51]
MALKKKIEYANLKIDVLVKNKIDSLKGRTTYSQWFDDIIDYVIMNGIDPKNYRTLPPALTITKTITETFKTLSDRLENAIKIIRSIETTKIDPMLHTIESIASGTQRDDIGPEEMQVFEMVKMNEQLQKENSEMNQIITNLKSTKLSDRKELAAIVDDLISEQHISVDNSGNYIITKEYKKLLIEKIRG